ncbi:hypothetical protein ACFE04_022074 [Oxalis oulophora]
MDESPIHQYRSKIKIWDLECKLIVEDLKVDLKTEAEKAIGGDTNQKKAFYDLEPIYTSEGTYDINTLVTGREITGDISSKNCLKIVLVILVIGIATFQKVRGLSQLQNTDGQFQIVPQRV